MMNFFRTLCFPYGRTRGGIPAAVILAIATLSSHGAYPATFAPSDCSRSYAGFSTFAAPYRGLLKTAGGRSMYHEYTPATDSKTVQIAVHGLGDSMDDMRALMRQLHGDGEGLLLVDQNGHGATLDGFRGRGVPIPDVLPYTDNVADMASVSEKYSLQQVDIVGHSMGGGTGHELARELQKKGVRLRNVTLMAPYVFRLDGFARRQAVEGTLLVEQIRKTLRSSGMKDRQIARTLANLRKSLQTASTPMVNWVDYLNNSRPIQDFVDRIVDPWLDRPMKESFSQYFTHKDQMVGLQYSPSQAERLQDRVEATLATMKGLRPLNFFDPAFECIKDVPVQVIAGAADQLVPRELLQLAVKHLHSRGCTNYSLTILPGGGHLFPQEKTEATAAKIRAFREETSR